MEGDEEEQGGIEEYTEWKFATRKFANGVRKGIEVRDEMR